MTRSSAILCSAVSLFLSATNSHSLRLAFTFRSGHDVGGFGIVLALYNGKGFLKGSRLYRRFAV